MAYKTVDVEKMLTGMIAPNTIISYVHAWKLYIKFAVSFAKAMNATTLTQWRQHMINVDGYAAGTINVRLLAIKTVARELYAHGEIDRETYWDMKEVRQLSDSALKERRRPNGRIRIEPEQMRAICTAPAVSEDNALALRDRALMMTLATTGARISEVVSMKVRDIVELPGNKFMVCNVLGKHQGEPRTVPLSPEAHSAIRDWLAFRPVASPYIFTSISYSQEDGGILYNGDPLNRNTASSRVQDYGKQVGLPHIKPHDFRRFVGTQLTKKDLRTAQRVLGHKSVSTTAEYYVIDEVQAGTTDSLF